MRIGVGLVAAALSLAAVGCVTPTHEAPVGHRDLNHDGKLDRYEDPRQSEDARVADLMAQMTLKEKVGTLLHGTLPAVDSQFGASSAGYDLPAIEALIRERGVTSMISRLAMPPARFAAQNNAVQKLAERSRLGIPITISSDPRNHFSVVAGASVTASGFSQWPEPLGLAALDDAATVRRFGSIAAAEYRAVGLHMALSPQADLATEPRWSRGNATFGSQAARVSRLAGAYVEGFQGGADGLKANGVATVVKHFVGYGAAPGGFDSHNAYGSRARLTNASFAQHLAAFDGAFRAKSAGVMPTYSIIEGVTQDGKPLEPVAAGFNEQLLGDLLRRKIGYQGLVVSDWGIINDCPEQCRAPTAQKPQRFAIGMPWGVESLAVEDRVAKGVNAGIDQFGGLDDPSALLAAVRVGKISTARLDQAVRRVLKIKFRLGLFDNPYVNERAAGQIVGSEAAQAAAAQRAAQVLLENRGAVVPLAPTRRKLWVHGVDPGAVTAAGFQVVSDPARADAALLRLSAPFEQLHPHHFFGSGQKEGRLDLRDGDEGYEALKSVAGRLPVILAVDLDRPAILTNVRDKANAVIGLFGASDAALLDVVSGKARALGRLPIELPRSMAAVEAQRPDLTDDSAEPLYPAGTGLQPRGRDDR